MIFNKIILKGVCDPRSGGSDPPYAVKKNICTDIGVTRNPAVVIRPAKLQQGFTLLELLVVMVIVGIILGMVSFSAIPNRQQALQNDAQRIALLLQLARDEAIVRNRPIAFEVDSKNYRFLLREDNTWQVLTQDDLLREREFKNYPMMFSMISPNSGINLPVKTVPLRIVFGREPVDKPFVLTLATDDAHAAIRADGIGHFVAE